MSMIRPPMLTGPIDLAVRGARMLAMLPSLGSILSVGLPPRSNCGSASAEMDKAKKSAGPFMASRTDAELGIVPLAPSKTIVAEIAAQG